MAGSDGAGPTLDAEAKAAYRARLVDLREELAEAESWHDPERIARLEAEQDALAHELSAALGIRGSRPSERLAIRTGADQRDPGDPGGHGPHRRAEPGARCPPRGDHQNGNVLRLRPGPARAARVAALTAATAGAGRGSTAPRRARARSPRSTAARSSSGSGRRIARGRAGSTAIRPRSGTRTAITARPSSIARSYTRKSGSWSIDRNWTARTRRDRTFGREPSAASCARPSEPARTSMSAGADAGRAPARRPPRGRARDRR